MKALASATFDQPLEMLEACHGRIKDQCDTLRRLAAHLPQRGSDDQAREAAAAVMRYFDTAGELHHCDEECDLLPRMIEAAHGGEATHVAQIVAKLHADHHAMREAWRAIRATLARITRGERVLLQESEVSGFAARYDAHIAFEEKTVLPLARALLGPAELAAIGAAMTARRTQQAAGTG
jgi:hemerythrin-like domain-containing protein